MTSLLLYAAALPTGVALTLAYRSVFSQSLALIATSLAVGTLLGCLIFDFLMPSLNHIRARRNDLGWIVVGLGFTQLLMRVFGT
jgi:hypothetical protein